MIRRPPRSTRTDTLFPYTTLFRSQILPGTAIMGIATQADYPPTGHTRVKRLHDRARYDRATVHAILDAGLLCHVGYVIEGQPYRSEEHTSELQSLMRISYAVFCLKKKKHTHRIPSTTPQTNT